MSKYNEKQTPEDIYYQFNTVMKDLSGTTYSIKDLSDMLKNSKDVADEETLKSVINKIEMAETQVRDIRKNIEEVRKSLDERFDLGSSYFI